MEIQYFSDTVFFSVVNTSGSIPLAEDYPKVSTTTSTNALPGFSRLPTGFHASRNTSYTLPNTSIYGDWPYNTVDQYGLNGSTQRNRTMSAAASLTQRKKTYDLNLHERFGEFCCCCKCSDSHLLIAIYKQNQCHHTSFLQIHKNLFSYRKQTF